MKAGALLILILLALPLCAENGRVLLDANFDTADLSGWRTAGDLCVAPSFCAGDAPGRYWIAFSTNNHDDAITMCGSNSVAGLQSTLRSPNLPLPFEPSWVRVEFKVKFLTNENTTSDLGTDGLVVRLLTVAGPLVIAAFDDAGPSPDSMNLAIRGDASFHESRCNPSWRYETGLLHVSYYRVFRDPYRSRLAKGPIALEFALSNQFDQDFDSAVLVDDVKLTVYP